jgi:hypothetical protein
MSDAAPFLCAVLTFSVQSRYHLFAYPTRAMSIREVS